MLIKLADTLGCSIDYLLSGREPAGLRELIAELERALAQARSVLVGGTLPSVRQVDPTVVSPAVLTNADDKGA